MKATYTKDEYAGAILERNMAQDEVARLEKLYSIAKRMVTEQEVEIAALKEGALPS